MTVTRVSSGCIFQQWKLESLFFRCCTDAFLKRSIDFRFLIARRTISKGDFLLRVRRTPWYRFERSQNVAFEILQSHRKDGKWANFDSFHGSEITIQYYKSQNNGRQVVSVEANTSLTYRSVTFDSEGWIATGSQFQNVIPHLYL